MAAKQHSANINTRTEFLEASVQNNIWHAKLKDRKTGEEKIISARILINAAGPWVNNILQHCSDLQHKNNDVITHVKGSHIIVPQLYTEQYAYILQNDDGRVIFILPYLDKYSLIGTTDVMFNNNLDSINISSEEINYLCHVVNQYIKQPIHTSDIIWSYAGVRSLVKTASDNPKDITRDYKLLLQQQTTAPILSILGGKITTHRALAEEVMCTLKPFFPEMKPNWTDHAILPGGDIPNGDFEIFKNEMLKKYTELPINLMSRYLRCYGTLCDDILQDCKRIEDLGKCYGSNLFHRELVYLMEHEWARTAEDVLWRRSKLGLQFSTEQTTYLDSVMQNYYL